MLTPPEFSEIIKQPLSEADKNTFLAEQSFMRQIDWAVYHRDLFSEVR